MTDKSASFNFARQHGMWRKCVLTDSALTPATRVIILLMGSYQFGPAKFATAGYSTLAGELDCPESAVREALRIGEACGYLKRIRGGGKKRTVFQIFAQTLSTDERRKNSRAIIRALDEKTAAGRPARQAKKAAAIAAKATTEAAEIAAKAAADTAEKVGAKENTDSADFSDSIAPTFQISQRRESRRYPKGAGDAKNEQNYIYDDETDTDDDVLDSARKELREGVLRGEVVVADDAARGPSADDATPSSLGSGNGLDPATSGSAPSGAPSVSGSSPARVQVHMEEQKESELRLLTSFHEVNDSYFGIDRNYACRLYFHDTMAGITHQQTMDRLLMEHNEREQSALYASLEYDADNIEVAI